MSSLVYKIKYTPLTTQAFPKWEGYVEGFSINPKVTKTGKVFTNIKVVNSMLERIKTSRCYGDNYKCKLIKFNIVEVLS